MDPDIKKAAEAVRNARLVVALTGAGISVESGIPPFRGKGGLWERFDPMEVAHIDSFIQNPARVWNLLVREMKEIMDKARPNAGHLGLSRLERMGRLSTVITQNVDGLHQAAGNTDVIEFHGNFAWQRCMDCGKKIATPDVSLEKIPPECSCGGILRPDCVFFGEAIPEDALYRSFDLAQACDVMLVVGTSAVVQPAASLPALARRSRALVIEINLEPTALTRHIAHVSLFGSAGEILSRLADSL
ncbi:MAG: NAD-dependent deacylase [Thermodesulfobacteriota bacterium]